MSALVPVGVLLSIVLIVITIVGSSKTTDLERSQGETAAAQRRPRGEERI